MQPSPQIRVGRSIHDNNTWDETMRTLKQLSLGFSDQNNNYQLDNFKGAWFNGITPAGANTEFTIPHNLGYIPIGFLVANKNKYSDFQQSSVTPWDKVNIYLQCNTSSVSCSIFVLG